MHARTVLSLLLLPALALGCTRSSPDDGAGGGGAASTLATENQGRVVSLEDRATTVETDLDLAETRLDAVETSLTGTQDDVVALEARVSGLEDAGPGGGGRADQVLIGDPAAAGFPAGTLPANVEEGLAALNVRDDAQEARTTTLEGEFNTNLQTTVTQVVQSELVNVQVQVDGPDVAFDPAAVVTDPRADATDAVPEYPFSANVDEAIRALRWAHQVRINAPVPPTLLAQLPRDYVQEAVAALDAELYDVRDGPIILGVSANTTGNMAEGGKAGAQAGDEKCAVAFGAQNPFAHMCSLDEAQRALAGERYTAGDFAAPVQAWLQVPTAGASANCDGGLNGQNGGTGYAVTVDLAFAGTDATGPVIDVAGGVTCDTSLPLLCCR